jgi:hypothetical protein
MLCARINRLHVLGLLFGTLTFGASLLATAMPAAAACDRLTSDKGQAKATIQTEVAGQYTLWLRMVGPRAEADSVLVQVDDQCPIVVGDAQPGDGFRWVNFQDGDTAKIIRLELTAGEHSVTLAGRETNVGADKLMIMNTNCIPEGFGENCLADEAQTSTSPQSAAQEKKAAATAAAQTRSHWVLIVSTGAAALGIGLLAWRYWYFLERQPGEPERGYGMNLGGVPLASAFRRTQLQHFFHHEKVWVIICTVAILIVTIVGIVAAANRLPAFEVESATLSGGAKVIETTEASGGKYVMFQNNSSSGGAGGGGGSGSSSGDSSGGGGNNDLALPRIPWDGGASYWQQFPKANAAGWDDPSFIPISVFAGRPFQAAEMVSIGVNTYMAMEHDGTPMGDVTNTGMFVMAQQNEWTLGEVGNDARVISWFVSDECEMGYTDCDPNCSNCDSFRLSIQQSYVDKVKAYNDGRFAWSNFGNGPVRTFWAVVAGTNPPVSTMPQWLATIDGGSMDKYAYTSPDVSNIIRDSPDWDDDVPVPRSYAYGWQVDRMRQYMGAHLKPTWAFVETGRPLLTEPGATVIQLDQIEGAVWSSIIHEARGIAYFQHSNDGTCAGSSILECGADRKSKVAAINAKVKSLAPVINTQSYQYNFNNGTDTMLKTYDSSAYIFAGIGMRQSPGAKTFALPPGVNGKTVTVVGEGRTIPVSNNSFSDTFQHEYTHHVYQIAL